MAYKIQFSISDKEYAELKAQAEKQHYPSVSAMCYALCFPKSTTTEMFEELIKKVKELPKGETFVIRELFLPQRIPTILGKMFAEGVAQGTIPNVRKVGRNNTLGADQYEKVWFM